MSQLILLFFTILELQLQQFYITFIVKEKNCILLFNHFQNVSSYSQSLKEIYYVKTQEILLEKFLAKTIENQMIIKNKSIFIK